MKFFKSLIYRVRLFFFLRYLVAYESITLRLLSRVSLMVRKLIVMKGRDPDYIAPPPPPPSPPVIQEKPRPYFYVPYIPTWVVESFRDAKKHPIHASRSNLMKPVVREEPLQVALNTVIDDPSLVVEISPNAVDIVAPETSDEIFNQAT